MIISVLGMAIGVLVAIAGIYYLVKDRHDRNSVKIYGIIGGVGAVVFVISLIILLTNIL